MTAHVQHLEPRPQFSGYALTDLGAFPVLDDARIPIGALPVVNDAGAVAYTLGGHRGRTAYVKPPGKRAVRVPPLAGDDSTTLTDLNNAVAAVGYSFVT